MKTLQETFDEVVSKIIKQGKKSTSSVGCLYRLDENTKCAVGQLIPDDKYSRDFESMRLTEIHASCPALQEHSLTLLRELQVAHDNTHDGEFVECFKKNVTRIAEMRGLNLNFEVTA